MSSTPSLWTRIIRRVGLATAYDICTLENLIAMTTTELAAQLTAVADQEAKALAAANSSKGKKKKWSKGKLKEKVNNMVLFDKATYEKLQTEVPKYKMITPSVLADRLRINGSLARAAIKELLGQGLIKVVSKSASQEIYTRSTKEA